MVAVPSQAPSVDGSLTETLNRGLVELCNVRPDDPKTWLANWLLANKPPPKVQPAGTAAAVQAVLNMYSTPDGKAALAQLWTELAKDGTISSKAWGRGVATHWKTMATFFGGCTIAEVGKAFTMLDVDGSGDLTWEEFEGAISGMDAALRLAHMLESKDNLAELKALFDTIDKDGDGRVTSKEWGSAVSKNQDIMRKYFGGKSLKQIGQAYRRLDADGSDDLTWDEFVAGSQRLIATDPS